MKRYTALILILAFLLAFTACGNGGETGGEAQTGPTAVPTAAPSETAPADATPAPEATPDPAPSAEPPTDPVETESPNARLIDEAWVYAEEIGRVYAFELPSKASGRAVRDENGATVQFGSDDRAFSYLEFRLEPGDDGADSWKLSRCYAYIPENEDLKKINADREAFGSSFTFTVTPRELEEAGFTLNGGGRDCESAAEYALALICGRLTSLGEDDLMRCTDAGAPRVGLRVYDASSGCYSYDGHIAVLPAHHRSFMLGFSEAVSGWLYLGSAYPACRYYTEISFVLTAERLDSGSFRVFCEVPEAEGC